MEEKFEIDLVNNNDVIELKNYEKTLEIANEILGEYQAFKIENDDELKIAKEKRAKLNKVVSMIDRRRIDTINDFTSLYVNQCKSLTELFDKRQKEIGIEINKYIESKKESVVSKPKVITATVKFYDEKVVDKLSNFCSKNNCELSVKK